MRRAAKVDTNDMSLTTYARSRGWHIETIGLPVDKLGCYLGFFFPIECKRPERRGKKDEFTSVQTRYMADCGGKVLVWYTESCVDRDTDYIAALAKWMTDETTDER